MPARRKTIAEAELSGARANHPARFEGRKRMLKTIGVVGAPPAHLTKEVAALFSEIAGLLPPGTAGRSDRLMIEIAAYLLEELRENPRTITGQNKSVLVNVLGRLGLDPQARTRITENAGAHSAQQAGPKPRARRRAEDAGNPAAFLM